MPKQLEKRQSQTSTGDDVPSWDSAVKTYSRGLLDDAAESELSVLA